MMENYALDAVVSYDTEPADPERELSNPAKKKLTSKIRSLRKELSEAHRRLGLLASGRKKSDGATTAELAAGRQAIGEEIRRLEQQIEALGKKRRKLPTRIKVRDLPSDAHFRLETERKILTDTVKLTAYRVESALLSAIRPHYSHAEQEGRQLIQEILQASADLHPAQYGNGNTGTIELCSPNSSVRETLRVFEPAALPLPWYNSAADIPSKRMHNNLMTSCQEV